MTENLLIITLILEPLINQPVKADNWYGQAAQALFLKAIRFENHGTLPPDLHSGSQLRPYTSSTLFSGKSPGFRDGCLQPGGRYFLRFTALNSQSVDFLRQVIQPGGLLALGAVVPLASTAFRITGLSQNLGLSTRADVASYELLWDEASRYAGNLPDHIWLHLCSPTAFSHSNQTKNAPLPEPKLFFQHLTDKWNLFSPKGLPEIQPQFLKFIQEKVRLAEYHHLDTHAVNMRKNTDSRYFIGTVGYLNFTCEQTTSPFWVLAHLLAAFSQFAGVGKRTTVGFGQCSINKSYCERRGGYE